MLVCGGAASVRAAQWREGPASVKGATEVELGPDRGPRVIAPREVEPLQVAAVVLDRTQACVMEIVELTVCS